MQLSLGLRKAERECVTVAFADSCADHVSSDAVINCVAIPFVVYDCVQLSVQVRVCEREHISVAVRIDCTDKDTVATFLLVVECESLRKRLFDALSVAISCG